MKQAIAIFVLSLVNYISFGQYLYPEHFDNCNITQFCLDCGNPEAKVPQNFGRELAKNLNSKSSKNINGSIELQILVDTLGSPCLLSVKNESNTKTSKLNIQQAVQNTPKWNPAISQGKPTRSSVSLKLNFIDGNISVQRRVFNTDMTYKDTPEIREIAESNLIEVVSQKAPSPGVISDSILYSLARQSLDHLTITRLKIFEKVMRPRHLDEPEDKIVRDMAHFSDIDLQSTKEQILNPTLSNWNNPIFTQDSNFDIVNTLTNEECVFIALPLVAPDTTTVVVYYEIWRYNKNKKSGSGTITVWKKSLLNEWLNQLQQIMWIREYERHKKFKEPGGGWKELEN